MTSYRQKRPTNGRQDGPALNRNRSTQGASRVNLDDFSEDAQSGPVSRDTQQHEEFGGRKWGAAFFGWLCAIGVTVLLLAIASAAGAAFGITKGSTSQATQNAKTIGIVGAIALLVILALGYYAGGYVAGRMARFDGAKQGVAVWVIGLLITVLLAIAGAIFGSKYNVLGQLNLPHIPVDEGTATTGGIVALVAVLVLTLLAAMAGGKVGDRYHRKIDRVGAEY
jgi:hypothetical protein